MDISDRLRCVFSAHVTEQDGSFVIEVPKHEIAHGNLECNVVYQTAMFATEMNDSNTAQEPEDSAPITDTQVDEAPATTAVQEQLDPPVETGDVRKVEIDAIGDQGDGITRVERGYVVIVPGTKEGDHVTIKITTVRDNVAFGEVVEEEPTP